MKNGRSRRHHSHGRASAVTTLPARMPPTRQSRSSANITPDTARAIPLPDMSEPLVEPTGPVPLSRQARRQELRALAKEMRRGGTPAHARHAPLPESAPAATVEAAAATPDTAPLPRERSLAIRRNGLIHVGEWLRGLFLRKPAPRRITPDQAVRQIQAMRAELAHMQHTLDQMLAVPVDRQTR